MLVSTGGPNWRNEALELAHHQTPFESFDAPGLRAKVHRRLERAAKKEGFCFVPVPLDSVPGGVKRGDRQEAGDGEILWTGRDGRGWAFVPDAGHSWDAIPGRGTYTLAYVTEGGGRLPVRLPDELSYKGQAYPGLLGLHGELCLAEQRFQLLRGFGAMVLPGGASALVVTAGSGHVLQVDLKSGEARVLAWGDGKLCLGTEALGGVFNSTAAVLPLPGRRFAIVTDGTLLVGSHDASGATGQAEGGSDALLLHDQLLLVASSDLPSSGAFHKAFGETVITAHDISGTTGKPLRRWYRWALPLQQAQLTLEDDRLWAHNARQAFELQQLEAGLRWFDEVFRDCHPPGTPAGTTYPGDDPAARTPPGPPEGGNRYIEDGARADREQQ